MPGTVVVVDDHPMCRQATAFTVRATDATLIVAEASSLSEARALAASASLMTLDLALPDATGVAGLDALRRDYPTLPIIVISGSNNPSTERQVARMGARGFLRKSAPLSEMAAAVHAVLHDQEWFSHGLPMHDEIDDPFDRLNSLTAAQSKILAAMEGGRLNKQIAHDLDLSEITVKAHVKAILRKLNVVNRTQAVLALRACHT